MYQPMTKEQMRIMGIWDAMMEQTQELLPQVRGLLRRVEENDFEAYYDLGDVMAPVIDYPNYYGPYAPEQLAQLAGVNEGVFYTAAKIRRISDRETMRALGEIRLSNGTPLTIAHLTTLVYGCVASQREYWLQRVIDENLSSDRLGKLIDRAVKSRQRRKQAQDAPNV